MPQPTHTEDLELARRVLANEGGALEVFVERMRCVGSILKVRNARLGRPLDAAALDDLVQDTLVVVWRRLHSFEGRGPLEAWVYRICSFELLSALRDLRRIPRSETDSGSELVLLPAVPPVEHEDQGPGKDRLLRHLASREAQVVELKHYEDMTFEQISELLEVSESTVKTHYYRGLEKLREVLGAGAQGMGTA